VCFPSTDCPQSRARFGRVSGCAPLQTVHVDGQDLFVPDIDGHHRLFFAALMGVTHIDMNLVWYPESLRTPQVGRKNSDYETMTEEYLADEMRSDLNIATG
jgi:hypothetical protein